MRLMLLEVCAAALLLAGVPARADVIEIALPDLVGYYPGNWDSALSRHSLIQLPARPAAIHGASLRVRGSSQVGSLLCDGGQLPYPIELISIMSCAQDACTWVADGLAPEASGPFALTIPFQALYGSETWDFLMDGQAPIDFGGMGPLISLACYSPTVWPSAMVEQASILVDVDFPVSAPVRTWGRIKGLYR